jgi:hypothetical protein
MCSTCPAHFILLDLSILIIYSDSTNYETCGHAVFSILLLHPNILLSTVLVYILPLMWETKFCTYTKQYPRLYRVFLNKIDAFMALRFTTTGASPSAKHMQILLMTQHAHNITFIHRSQEVLKMLSICT